MYRIGIDLGGTNIAAGIVNEKFEILAKESTPTLARQRPNEAIVDDMAMLCKKLCQQIGITEDAVSAVGVVSPGVVDDVNGYVTVAENMGFKNFPLVPLLRERISIQNIYIENDANAAAWGEAIAGAAKGTRNSVMITLGTGVGGGVVLDGKIVAGKNGGAGEIGHMTVEPAEKRFCTCGKQGCLEQYASARGVADMAKRMLAACDTPSALRGMGDFTARDLCRQAEQGDAMAQAVLERFGDYLGRAMSLISCTVDPDVYIIGGGMSQAGETVLRPVRRAYRKYAFHVSAQTETVIAGLGNDAGIYGCAKMVFSR